MTGETWCDSTESELVISHTNEPLPQLWQPSEAQAKLYHNKHWKPVTIEFVLVLLQNVFCRKSNHRNQVVTKNSVGYHGNLGLSQSHQGHYLRWIHYVSLCFSSGAVGAAENIASNVRVFSEHLTVFHGKGRDFCLP